MTARRHACIVGAALMILLLLLGCTPTFCETEEDRRVNEMMRKQSEERAKGAKAMAVAKSYLTDTGVKGDIAALSFPTQTSGWGVTAKGETIHTSDAGKTWEQQNTSNKLPLDDIKMVDELNGVAVGPGGVFYITHDGGKTWKAMKTFAACLFDIFFLNKKVGWIVGNYGQIYRTDDGGKSWKAQQEMDPRKGKMLDSVHFANEKKGWATGPDTALETTDGGATWHEVKGEKFVGYSGEAWIGNGEGWRVGKNGKVEHTTDEGKTWQAVDLKTDKDLAGVYVHFTPSNVFILANDGSGFVSTDGGKTWEQTPAPAGETAWKAPSDVEMVYDPGSDSMNVVAGFGRRTGVQELVRVFGKKTSPEDE